MQKILQVDAARRGRRRRSTTPTSTRCTRPSARTTCRPSRWRRARRASACSDGDPDREEQLPTTVRQPRAAVDGTAGGRRARRGPRRRHGAAVALLHAGARRRDHGLRHPGPRRVGAPRRLRQRRVAGDGPGRPAHRGRVGQRHHRHRSSRRSRSRRSTGPGCCRDVAQALADHHVNILSCNDAHRLRPHLEDALRLRARRPVAPRLGARRRSSSIDSVYDAYRVVPGQGRLRGDVVLTEQADDTRQRIYEQPRIA